MSAGRNWQPKLGDLGAVVADGDDIAQCLTIILTTPPGSVPHRPDFGTSWLDVLDRPLTEAVPRAVARCLAAIQRWEPRIRVTQIQAAPQVENPGHLVVSIAWAWRQGIGGGSVAVPV